MSSKKINEDCGCGGTPSQEPRTRPVSKDLSERHIGKVAQLFDGRQAMVDDSIRNSKGEVIGYILTSPKGAFRVFKDKIQCFSESADMGSLAATVGQGSVTPPSRGHEGSGDQFPSIGAEGKPQKGLGTRAKKAQKENRFTNKLMGFNDFAKKMKEFQQDDKSNKK